MDTKTCNKCGVIKPLSEYYKHPKTKDGYRSSCKECLKIQNNEYKTKLNHDTKITEKTCTKCQTIKPISEFNKRYDTKSGYKSQCKSCRKESRKIWQETYKPRRNSMRQERRKTDPQYRLSSDLRSRIYSALNGITKSKTTMDLIGCSIEQLQDHLQMTAITNGYENFNINDYSGKDYHIDHIIPCSNFDLSLPEEQYKCFHYTNLQILSAEENLSKSDKLLFK